MSASAVPAVIDALVAAFAAAVDADVQVLDGDLHSDDPAMRQVVVGAEAEEDVESAATTQEWAALGNQAKKESGQVNCSVHVLDGAGGMRDARQAVYALFGVCEQALRPVSTPWLGVAGVLSGTVTSTTLRQEQTDDGARAALVFTVSYNARI